MRNGLIVVGSANVDLIVPVDRHPRPGETVLGGDTVTAPGGKGANTAVAAARAGAAGVGVALLGAVGSDANGELLLTALGDAGVDTSWVQRTDGPSGAAYIAVDREGENTIVVSPGANARVDTAMVDRAADAIRAAAVLFAVLEVPLPTVEYAARIAAGAGVRVVVNASPVAKLPDETMRVLDPLIVNQHEAAALLPGRHAAADGAELAEALRQLGPRSVVVTLGADGAVVADAEGLTKVPAPQVDVVDTTGAGDAFAGTLCSHLAAGSSLREATGKAVVRAAEVVTRHGAQVAS
ncbi:MULTISPECIES: ribokinase [Thermocrispum]|jgi:ribokinase|uniref:Ribokinase n=1 Tax=Thermocrispum agreste TaxID=37925 RepID=A0A2W4JLA6_9PSEU|nr:MULTISPECIES: ribokinase [Thermocrispum]PZM99932.1 MAG: ribokinase [Thermocrispum agreste]